jgi:zinc transporter 2
VTSRCTIARTGSHEIEVRCELPAPSALDAAAGGVGAGKSSSRPATGHAHSHGHDHGHSHEAGSINLRSAVLHVIGDILQSIGVAIAGALIWYNQDDPRWYIADPICTFIFSIVVLLTTKSILRDIVHVLMERTPTNIDIPAMSQVCCAGPLTMFCLR